MLTRWLDHVDSPRPRPTRQVRRYFGRYPVRFVAAALQPPNSTRRTFLITSSTLCYFPRVVVQTVSITDSSGAIAAALFVPIQCSCLKC